MTLLGRNAEDAAPAKGEVTQVRRHEVHRTQLLTPSELAQDVRAPTRPQDLGEASIEELARTPLAHSHLKTQRGALRIRHGLLVDPAEDRAHEPPDASQDLVRVEQAAGCAIAREEHATVAVDERAIDVEERDVRGRVQALSPTASMMTE